MSTPWSKPQLIELVRGAPEEAVLSACKTTLTGTAPHNVFDGCRSSDAPDSCGLTAPTSHINAIACIACSVNVSS